jgi:hypothetical protein
VVLACAGIGLVFAGAWASEHGRRRLAERRTDEALEGQWQMALRVRGIIATHERLTQEVTRERQRAQELADALLSTRQQLEETAGRLTQERQRAGELNARLASLQGQMEQLQGELAVTLKETQGNSAWPRAAGAPSQSPVQLERIVVSRLDGEGIEGRVLSVHPEWGFVVIDLGWDAVRIGDVLSVLREDDVLATVRIERVQEAVCAAAVIPEHKAGEVRINDLVRML